MILHLPTYPSSTALVHILAIESLCWDFDRKMEKSQIKLGDNQNTRKFLLQFKFIQYLAF